MYIPTQLIDTIVVNSTSEGYSMRIKIIIVSISVLLNKDRNFVPIYMLNTNGCIGNVVCRTLRFTY